MHREFLMGNEAIALGALAAGVQVAAGYPGTPSTEVLETLARRRPQGVYVEWSVNEKAALEVAAGAAYSGARALVTMKQVGLNVASDPLMSLSYIGVKGALVVLVADDPGPISSQTEQDTRTFGMYSKIPVFDPSDAREAFRMMRDAFRLSEEYGTPVIVRPTTRIDHAYRDMEVPDEDEYERHPAEGFVRDPSRWVIFPRLSTANHAKMEARNDELSRVLSRYPGNIVLPEEGVRGRGIVSQGASWTYVLEALPEGARPRLMKVGTPFPFPEDLALDFLSGLDEVLAVEELDPVLERALQDVIGRHGLSVRVRGKRDGTVKRAGENTPGEVRAAVRGWLGEKGGAAPAAAAREDLPPLPVRAPVLCAGCPHRASFYAVKRAMQGQKAVFCGDIGCYTLGNAKPLDMCDTCLCMGAGIDIAQGIARVDPGTKAFAFVGDSTFFASGMTGVLNGVYNGADMTLVVLDNSTTAMTGHQPHPGTGLTAMGDAAAKADIESVLRGIGVETVEAVNPLDLARAVDTVRRVSGEKGVKAVIFRYPCAVRNRPKGPASRVDPEKCTGCRRCVAQLGCPAISWKDGRAFIDPFSCTGCTLCEQVCPSRAISGGGAKEPEPAPDGGGARRGRGAAAKAGEGERIDPASFGLKNILLAGVGGQGTVLAARLLASAAMRASLPVLTAETIGMAQRGGSVSSHVRIGEGAFSPLIGPGTADLVLGFEPAEAARMLPYLKRGGTVVTSARPVVPVSSMTGGVPYDEAAILAALKEHAGRLVLVDAEKALKEIGNEKVLNVLLLAAAADTGELGFDREVLRGAAKDVLPEKALAVNMAALDMPALSWARASGQARESE